MQTNESSSQGSKGNEKSGVASKLVVTPSIDLPKGGGALKGIEEKFQANPATGSASFSIPLPLSPSRGGVTPEVGLSYDSGAGNGPFGLGWSLSIPSITRKTEKGLPQYNDAAESDVFIMSGAEDLVPIGDVHTRNGFTIRTYRPRIEGAFAHIEQWTSLSSGEMHWRTITADNMTRVYGENASARITNPSKPSHVFQWLLEFTHDGKGSVVCYDYKAENVDGVIATLSERNRLNGNAPFVNRYLKSIRYGNKTCFDGTTRPTDFHFTVVFDYGEYGLSTPTPTATGLWAVRSDPFSQYRSGFDVRTWRRCSRVLLFHSFTELGASPCLVRSVDFTYGTNNSGMSLLQQAVQYGYKQSGTGSYTSKSLPPMAFTYEAHAWNSKVCEVDSASLAGLPIGLAGREYHFLDLYGEGLSGVLAEQGEGWYYKRNLGNGKFGASAPVDKRPSTGNASGIQEMEGDTEKYLVDFDGDAPGFYRLEGNGIWSPHQTFKNLPQVNLNDPNVKFLDLDGDGRADLLVDEDRALLYYRSEGKDGFSVVSRFAKGFDEEKGPRIVFADLEQSIYLADMSGDGLTDIVRVRNGSVCYWSNLGYGRFGAKVSMDASPRMDHPDLFNPAQVKLADVDGSGPADLIYIGRDKLSIWLNKSGNGYAPVREISPFCASDSQSQVAVLDLLGQGTACVVWSSQLAGDYGRSLRYIDLMGGKKPHLMIGYSNSCGKTVELDYTPSTRFYLDDRAAGKPWVTRLPFPVHCLSKVVSFDHVSGHRFSNVYSYHHGYYDVPEREFRGFGCVESLDSEDFESFADASNGKDVFLHQAPVLTRTWYHLGAWIQNKGILDHYAAEYNAVYKTESALVQPVLDSKWTAEEVREAMRAFKGRVLRQEVYAQDGTLLSSNPYTTAQTSYEIRCMQEKGNNRHASFLVIQSETLTYNYERNLGDPRVAHTLVLMSDFYGRPTLAANVVYPRLASTVPPITEVDKEQGKTHIVVTETRYTADVDDQAVPDVFRMGATCSVKTWEFTHPVLPSGLLALSWLNTAFHDASPISFETTADVFLSSPPTPQNVQKRLLECAETLYLDANLSAALTLGIMSSHGLPYEGYTLAYTSSLLDSMYGASRITDAMLAEGGFEQRTIGNWWATTGRQIYATNAKDHFYLPSGVRSPFGAVTQIIHDSYDLLTVSVTDALGNIVSAGNDYRTLAPVLMTDPNGNRTAVETDELGMVVKTAVMGKVGSTDGDTLADPTTKLVYSLDNWRTNGKPNFVRTYAREKHGSTNPRWQEKAEYSDGSGHALLSKVQAEPGDARQWDSATNTVVVVNTGTALRWVGTGRTVLNNKGNPVKQYEPYFSVTDAFESEPELVETGVTPILYYDPLGRLVRTDLPDGSFSKVEFTPWMQTSFDPNDTVLDSQWYKDRGSPDPTFPEPTNAETRAAWLAAKHANTPSVTHFDTLGRAFYVIADNGGAGKFSTRTELDIEGNESRIVDARNNPVMEYRYGIHGEKGFTRSMDAGDRYLLITVDAKPLYTWDNRSHRIHVEYDALRRPLKQWLSTNGAADVLVGQTIYGESANTPQANNLRAKPWKSFDQSGLTDSAMYDFKGNLLQGNRQLAIAYKTTINWNVTNPDSLLESETFTTITAFDALNRAVSIQTPHTTTGILASEVIPTYNEASLLNAVDVKLRGSTTATNFVSNIDYDAKGQRERIAYGNGATTRYTYDEKTFRLRQLLTTRNSGADTLQDLSYTYDTVGNIAQILDVAHQTLFYNGQVVSPTQKFEYDALYRLTKTTGREHAQSNDTTEPELDAYSLSQSPMPSDATALRNYERKWNYDEVGNILALIHKVNGSVDWQRDYAYATTSNRLNSTTVGQSTLTYAHNEHGSMVSMPHLQAMEWDFAERLNHITRGTTEAYYNYDTQGQRVRKVVVKGNITETRMYLGGFEVYRKTIGGQADTVRETLHVMDDKRRVALVETLTTNSGTAVANPSAVLRYQLDNHLGSASLELDVSANLISYEEYYPYGDTSYQAGRSASEVGLKRYRYTGKEKDEESGLYYHGARYYACWLGRWTSSDPAGLVDGTNLYMYVRGNPVRLNDPSGKASSGTNLTLPNVDIRSGNTNLSLPQVDIQGGSPTIGGMNGSASGSFSLSNQEGSPFLSKPNAVNESITGVRYSPNGEAAPADASSVAQTRISKSNTGIFSMLSQGLKNFANATADKMAKSYFGYAVPAAWPALESVKTEEQKQSAFKTDAYLTTGILMKEFSEGGGKQHREFKQGIHPFADSVLAGRTKNEIIKRTDEILAKKQLSYGQWSQTKDTLKIGMSFSPDQTSLRESIHKHMNSNLEQLFIGGSIVHVFPGDSNSVKGVLINSTSRSSLMLHISDDYTRRGKSETPLSTIEQRIFFSFERRH